MTKTIVHEETMCCGNKRCPRVTVYSDGSADLVDDDTETGSVGTVKLSPEQVIALGRVLQDNGWSSR